MASGSPPLESGESPLWVFALLYWQHPGMETTSLTLQARGWSVTRILCAGWLAAEGRRYCGDEPEHLVRWRQNMTERIRDLRKSVSKDNESLATLRQLLAKAELEAERQELDLAWQWLSTTESCRNEVRSLNELAQINLRAAAPCISDPDDGAEQARLEHIAAQLTEIRRQYQDRTRNRENV